MAVLTEMTTHELIVPIPPSTVYAMVEYRGPQRWQVFGGHGDMYSTPLDAMLAIRDDVVRTARNPVIVEIRWRNVPQDFKPPTTGTTFIEE